MLKAVNDAPVPKTSCKNLCPCSLWDVSTTKSRFLTDMLVDQSKNLKKKKIKETGIARCTDILNDQKLDKVASTDSETDFSSTESALWEWHARKEHNFPVSKKLAVTQRFAQQIFRSKSSWNTNYSKHRQK